MEFLFSIILIIHIAGGSIGLLSGSVNLLSKKGGKRHRQIGKIFVSAMLTAGISSLLLSIMHPNSFLFMVGIFTTYMVGAGVRYMRFRNSPSIRAGFTEWSLTVLMALSGTGLLIFGVYLLLSSNSFGWVYVSFSTFGLLFVLEDSINFRGKSKTKNYWLVAHISRMTGGYIASLTAFLVVNAHYLPFKLPLVAIWLFPSALLVPFIFIWTKKFRARKTVQHSLTNKS